MVSTRRQKQRSPGLNAEVDNGHTEDLAIRAKTPQQQPQEPQQSPPALDDVRTLRDGTVHGIGVSDRPNKRRRTSGRGGITSKDASTSGAAAAAPASSDLDRGDREDVGDTIEVAGEAEEGETPKSKSVVGGAAASETASPSAAIVSRKHRRFGSEKPEDAVSLEVQDGTEKAIPEANGVAQEGEEDEDDDDAPEEVTTTSRKPTRSLPPVSQPRKKTKKRKREDARDDKLPTGGAPIETAQQLNTINQENAEGSLDKEIHVSSDSISSEPSFMTAPEPVTPHPLISTAALSSSSPATVIWKTPAARLPSNHHQQQQQQQQQEETPSLSSSKPQTLQMQVPSQHRQKDPKPIAKSKPKKDIHIPSQNLTIKYIDDTSFFSPASGQNKRGSLPMKVNSQSKNMRDQLLNRNKLMRSAKGFNSGVGGGKGFLAR